MNGEVNETLLPPDISYTQATRGLLANNQTPESDTLWEAVFEIFPTTSLVVQRMEAAKLNILKTIKLTRCDHCLQRGDVHVSCIRGRNII